MRNLKRLSAIFGLTAGFGVASMLVLAACSSDDTVVTFPDGGEVPDGNTPIPPNPDADTETDGGADAAFDAPSIGDFPAEVAKAMCARIADCCMQDGGAPIEAATCEAQWRNGWELSMRDLRAKGVDPANVVIDSVAAESCLGLLHQFSCGAITAAQWNAITTQCYAAASGKLAAGEQGCHSSVECQKTTFCDRSDAGDAGGTCKPLLAEGDKCGTWGNEACSYRATGAFCDPFVNANGSGDPGAECKPTIADGIGCRGTEYFNTECASGLCGDDGFCGGTSVFVFPRDGNSPGLCDYYRDAGADGG